MRRKESVHRQVYNSIFPSPDKAEPPSWNQFVRAHLVPEVRCEVVMFYGETNSVDARFPGLDYCWPPHRHRLSRHCGHRKLFQAFDRLHLTYNEIYQLCNWEGTLYTKHKYERENNTTVQDTTGDEVVEFYGPPVYDEEEDTLEEGEVEEEDEEDDVMSDAKSEVDEDEDEEPEDVSATFQAGENGLSYPWMLIDAARRHEDDPSSRETTPSRDSIGITREQARAWRFIMNFDISALCEAGFGQELFS
ncbi:MAG: hypothetical protein M1831_003460 [Alyxoria varia]|nr:MAG: hypothetical protein M1831_003460 [Alyxoria varia]